MAKVRQDVGTIVSQQEKKVSNREKVFFRQFQNIKKGAWNVKPDTFFTDEMGIFYIIYSIYSILPETISLPSLSKV